MSPAGASKEPAGCGISHITAFVATVRIVSSPNPDNAPIIQTASRRKRLPEFAQAPSLCRVLDPFDFCIKFYNCHPESRCVF